MKVRLGFFCLISLSTSKKKKEKLKTQKFKLTVSELAEGVALRVARALVHDQVERREPAVRGEQPLDSVGVPVAR